MNMNLNMTTDDLKNKGTDFIKDPNLFSPNVSKAQNGIYQCIGRFLPWYKDAPNSKYRKYSVTLKNILANETIKVDCPSTISKPSILWDLHKILKERLKQNEHDIVALTIGKAFNRYVNFISPFYIYQNPSEPETQGKIWLYNFGSQIDKIVQSVANPAGGELLQNQMGMPTQAINPYDPVNGKDFVLVVSKKTKQFNTYDSSYFSGVVTPFFFPVQDQSSNWVNHVVTAEELGAISQGQETNFSRLLITGTPDLEKYHFKEWDDTTRYAVANYLRIILTPYPQIMELLLSSTFDESMREYMRDNLSKPGMTQYDPSRIEVQQPGMQIQQPAYPQVQQPVYQQPSMPVNPQVQQPVNPQVQPPVYPQVQQPVNTQVQPPVYPQVQPPVYPQVQQPINPQVQQPVYPQVQQPVYPQVQQPINTQVQQPINPQVQQPNTIPNTPVLPVNPAPPMNLNANNSSVQEQHIVDQNKADFNKMLNQI